jgi:hypothetical protein
MVKLNRKQREALYRVFNRCPLDADANKLHCPSDANADILGGVLTPLTYRQFRQKVQPMLGGGGVMIHWCGMWLGIETDGYTHS